MCDLRNVDSSVDVLQSQVTPASASHSGSIHIILKLPAGIASVSKNHNNITFWDSSQNKLEKRTKFCGGKQMIHDLCYNQELEILFIAASNHVIVYKDEELGRIIHPHPIRQVQVCPNPRKAQYEVLVYTISADDVLRGWVYEYYSSSDKPATLLFEKENYQSIPIGGFMSSGESFWVVHSDHCLALLDTTTGVHLREFKTFASEMISSVKIYPALDGSQSIAITTPNSLYFEFEMWSSGGSMKDAYRYLEQVEYASCEGLIGYSCAEDKTERGIVSIISLKYGRRVYTFFQPCKVQFWSFLRSSKKGGGVKWVVTVGADNMVRVFDIKNYVNGLLETREVLAQYPLNCKTTSFLVADEGMMIIGDENGSVRQLKFYGGQE
jgi:WD40 repeat protein